jgi:hypothetical protein
MTEALDFQGSAAEWTAAIATFSAVGVALWIAIRDGRKRDELRRARSLARARLVLVPGAPGVTTTQGSEGYKHAIKYRFENHSGRPVLDVHVEAWSASTPLDGPATWGVHDEIALPGRDEPWVAYAETPTEQLPLAAWRVRWTDADGHQWFVDHQGDPEPYKGQAPRRY